MCNVSDGCQDYGISTNIYSSPDSEFRGPTPSGWRHTRVDFETLASSFRTFRTIKRKTDRGRRLRFSEQTNGQIPTDLEARRRTDTNLVTAKQLKDCIDMYGAQDVNMPIETSVLRLTSCFPRAGWGTGKSQKQCTTKPLWKC